MPAGRPPFYSTPEELQAAIEAYFKKCDDHVSKVLTKTGAIVDFPTPIRYNMAALNYELGYSSSGALADLANDKPEYSETIARARLKIESCRVNDLVDPDTHNANGIKFDLTNNFGWKESSELNIGGQKGNPLNVISDPDLDRELDELQKAQAVKDQGAGAPQGEAAPTV